MERVCGDLVGIDKIPTSWDFKNLDKESIKDNIWK
jgi:hypothetical protein